MGISENKVAAEKAHPVIQFQLTIRQNKQLGKLFGLANEAWAENNPGMVLMRLQDVNEFQMDPLFNMSIAVFVPGKYAKKIQAIMNEYYKESKETEFHAKI